MGTDNFSQEIKKAEIKRVLRHIGVKHNMAKYHAKEESQFSIFHFAQILAYEEAMLIVRNIFAEELEEEE